ncbi:class 1 fructose-bisphosphatase [Brucella pseudogrignonensis]|uniref:Fructose-1,6-bisphosphatase class 1 n=1 Tax=Brucella pseudogrignonensis TaxID=419475 RepID=A0A256GWN6_9HYPH|nr:class 1 fructose-bisphosphatase [Brucella pseudogrignonensis]OYR30951.1 fructose-1-6-bisphosphatase family protein [Brucella pseudogrignonensis]
MTYSLADYLDKCASSALLREVGQTVLRLSTAAVAVHRAIATCRVPELRPVNDQASNPSGEVQKPLDVFADDAFRAAAIQSPVRVYGTEERAEPIDLGGLGKLALAIDPLDGSSNIETNISVGTIFSLLPLKAGDSTDPCSAFEQPGVNQLAAGFFIYGAQLLLVLTIGFGTQTFIHQGEERGFSLMGDRHQIPVETSEYSINASNRRHWAEGIRHYIEDTEAGMDGPRGRDFGMRYAGSLVADTYRILRRGGVFLYPGDRREGYRGGRLRQVYETNPIAFCIEQAGGAATDGRRRMLEIDPPSLHVRAPFVFGSRDEVDAVLAYASAGQADVSAA